MRFMFWIFLAAVATILFSFISRDLNAMRGYAHFEGDGLVRDVTKARFSIRLVPIRDWQGPLLCPKPNL